MKPKNTDSLAGKGAHRKAVAELFRDMPADVRQLAASHLTLRRDRLRQDWKTRQAEKNNGSEDFEP